jgi:hypothetical protein
MTAAAHASREAFVENGSRPELAAWVQRFRDLPADDVEWNDGEIVAGAVG